MEKTYKISLFNAILLNCAIIFGSGWLFSPQIAAQYAGNYSFIAWVAVAITLMGVGISYTYITEKHPVNGALSVINSLTHNGIFGMPFAFANWMGMLVALTAGAIATTQYLSPSIHTIQLTTIAGGLNIYGKIFTILILILYVLVNYFGVKLLVKVSGFISLIKVIAPIIATIILLTTHFDVHNFSHIYNTKYNLHSIMLAIVNGGLIFSLNGFQTPVAYTDDIHNPRKNLIIIMVASLIIVTAVYLLLQLAFMGIIPNKILNSGGWGAINYSSPLLTIAIMFNMYFLYYVITTDCVISPMGTGSLYLGASARMSYSMTKEKQLPSWAISNIHPKYNLCRRSVILNFLIAVLFVFFAKNWIALMIIVSGFHIIGYMSGPIGMGAIRQDKKIFGMVLFIVLSLFMYTISYTSLILINTTITALTIIYFILNIKIFKLHALLISSLPFILYLWLLTIQINYIILIAISIIFYLLVTSKKYVQFCKQHVNSVTN